jgi:hypothetical protein
VLLWSPETQVAVVTNESARRSEMIQAQVIRETARKTLSREEFLDTLDVQVKFITVTSTDDVSFARAFELLNKTNQFNTTGKRWSLEEINRGLEDGLQLVCFFVEDKFTEYGLVGVVLLKNSEVLQYVMSCRVLGLDVEKAVLSYVAQLVKASGGRAISAKLIETAANFPCRKLYSESGFAQDGELWQIDIEDQHLVMPAHIRVDAGFKPAAPEPQVMSVTKDDFPLVDLSDFKALQIEPELKFPSATLERGSTYSFSDPSPAWLGEAIGIGHRENWGFWTIDDRATLTFAVKPSIQEPIELLMRLRPFLASEKPEQAMRLVINGFPVSRWVFKGKLGKLYDIRFRIPATYLGSDGHIALTFEFGNPTSPRQLGISDDPRRLGAGLLSISVAEYA